MGSKPIQPIEVLSRYFFNGDVKVKGGNRMNGRICTLCYEQIEGDKAFYVAHLMFSHDFSAIDAQDHVKRRSIFEED